MRIKKFLLTIAAAFGLITVSAVAANADTVTVKSGDTLSKIATEYNTTVSSIQQLLQPNITQRFHRSNNLII